MKSITLISDWKLRDPYVAMFKGKIVSVIPDVQIFDISHAIPLYEIEQTAFILQNSYKSFPEGSLHIMLTGTSFSDLDQPILAHVGNHFFLGNDNGIFSSLFGAQKDIQGFQYQRKEGDNEFPFLDKLIQMMKWFFDGEIALHTKPYSSFRRLLTKQISYNEKEKILMGHIAYIDTCCNAVTNIPTSLFIEKNITGKFSTKISSSPYLNITKWYNFYNHKEQDPYLVSSRLGHIEITMYQSHIAILGDIKVGDQVEIRFH